MSTTCQFLVDRAKGFNQLNGPLAADAAEMLTRIRAIQQRIFTSCAELTRARFTVTVAVTSTSGTSDREIELSTLTLPVERVLKLKLSDGRTVSQVDELDVDAELEPRYLQRGTKLIEVEDDWSAADGIVAATLTYVYGASAISPTGTLSGQTVSVPDEWTDTIILPLAMYLHGKDPGREPMEFDRLKEQYVETWDGFIRYLTNYGGNEVRRFHLPSPPEIDKT